MNIENMEIVPEVKPNLHGPTTKNKTSRKKKEKHFMNMTKTKSDIFESTPKLERERSIYR